MHDIRYQMKNNNNNNNNKNSIRVNLKNIVLYFGTRIQFRLYIINYMEIYARTIFNSNKFSELFFSFP